MGDTKPYVLPVSLEACIAHFRLMRLGKKLDEHDELVIGETHRFIEIHMQMLEGHEELIHCGNCGKLTKHISTGEMCVECKC